VEGPEQAYMRSESPLKVRPIPVPSPETVDVLGVPLALTDYEEMLDWIDAIGHSLTDRVYGPELLSRACEPATERGHRFYLYGGRNPGALVQLALNLRQRYSGVKIVGGYSPPH